MKRKKLSKTKKKALKDEYIYHTYNVPLQIIADKTKNKIIYTRRPEKIITEDQLVVSYLRREYFRRAFRLQMIEYLKRIPSTSAVRIARNTMPQVTAMIIMVLLCFELLFSFVRQASDEESSA